MASEVLPSIPQDGSLVETGYGEDTIGDQTDYVHHIENPVRFQREIKATIEHGHGNHLANEMSSVAYWYAAEPAPAMQRPPVEKRLPVLRDNQGRWLHDPGRQTTSRVIAPNEEMLEMLRRWPERNS